jgi:hypothetical protein
MVRIHWQTRRPIVKTRISSAAALAVASVFLLAGCSFSFGGPTTVSSDDLADLAEEALEDEYDDSSWKVDCDDDDEEVEVKLEEDESIDCLATDKDSDLEYDAEVTITDVDGDKYEIEVELDDEANNADEESDDDSDSKGDGDSDGETYFVSGEDLAALAVEALAPQLGYEPADMECDSDQTEIYEGNWDFCDFTDEDGNYQLVDVTIDSFDKKTGKYTITAEIF